MNLHAPVLSTKNAGSARNPERKLTEANLALQKRSLDHADSLASSKMLRAADEKVYQD